MEPYRIKETNIKNKNGILNRYKNTKKNSVTFVKKEKSNINHNLNINQKISQENRNTYKPVNSNKFSILENDKKYYYPINKTVINKSNLILIKRKGAFRLIEIKPQNKNKMNINNKTEIGKPLTTIRKVVSEYKNNLNNEYNDVINDKQKHNITEFNKINKINIYNYINNKKCKLNSIEKEKESLINKNCQQKLLLIKKQKQEYKELEKFLKTELVKNLKNQKILEKDKNELLYNKIKFKFTKRKDNNISTDYFKQNKKISLAPVKSLNYNNNHSELQKSLQKYFSLSPKDLKGNMFFKPAKDNKKETMFYNKNGLTENISKNLNLKNIQIKKINYKKIKKSNDKITKFKKKSIQLTIDNNNLIKSLDFQGNYKNKMNFENEKNILNINKNNCLGNKIKHKKAISTNQNYINYKSFFLNHSSKSKSLNIVYNLEDYTGPNLYDNMIVPNHKKTIYQRLSSEKEKEKKELKKNFNTEDIKNTTEYFDKLRNRANKTPDDYYNKKDFDKLVLSGEKKSKYFKIRNLLYNSAFNTNKLEFKKI